MLTLMVKDIEIGEAAQIHAGTNRQEFKAGPRDIGAALACQHLVQHGTKTVQIQNIACRVCLLRLTQRFGTPVRGLLLLGNLDADEFGAQILQTMPVGIGAAQLRGDLGTVDGTIDGTDGLCQRGKIEPCEVKQLGDSRIGQNARQMWCGRKRMRHLYQMRVTVTRRQLNKAQPVPMRVQPHRFGVDGNLGAKVDAVRQVIMVKMYGHPGDCPQSLASGRVRHRDRVYVHDA